MTVAFYHIYQMVSYFQQKWFFIPKEVLRLQGWHKIVNASVYYTGTRVLNGQCFILQFDIFVKLKQIFIFLEERFLFWVYYFIFYLNIFLGGGGGVWGIFFFAGGGIKLVKSWYKMWAQNWQQSDTWLDNLTADCWDNWQQPDSNLSMQPLHHF